MLLILEAIARGVEFINDTIINFGRGDEPRDSYSRILQKMAESKLLVKTTLGTSILDLESIVNVHLKDNVYLTKEAIDLNPGDLVIFGKEYIETTLEQVEPYLDLSPRYMHAKRQVHEQNSKGEFIPLLRTELWRGLLKKQNKYNESLEGIIKKDTDDFQKDEYAEAVTNISELLYDRGIEISEAAIRNWLKGERFSPREWKIFSVLSELNPIFREFDETNRSYDGKHYNYKFFVIARQVIMRYLARLRGEEFKEKEGHKTEGFYKIRLDNEIELVVKSLMQDKGKDYALTRVIETQMLHRKDPRVRQVKRDPENRLSKGIVSHVSGIEIKSKNMQEFFKEHTIVSEIFSYLLDRYIDSRHRERCEKFLAKDEHGDAIRHEDGVRQYQNVVKQFILHKYNAPQSYKSDYAFEKARNYFDGKKFDELEELADTIINEIFNSTMDDAFSVPKDSCKKLFETDYRLNMLRPKILIDYEKLTDQHDDSIERMEAIKKRPYKTKDDEELLRKIYVECEPVHERIMKMQKRIAERFPVSFIEKYHGMMRIHLVNGKNDKSRDYIERTMSAYDLNEFREIFKSRFLDIYKD